MKELRAILKRLERDAFIDLYYADLSMEHPTPKVRILDRVRLIRSALNEVAVTGTITEAQIIPTCQDISTCSEPKKEEHELRDTP